MGMTRLAYVVMPLLFMAACSPQSKTGAAPTGVFALLASGADDRLTTGSLGPSASPDDASDAPVGSRENIGRLLLRQGDVDGAKRIFEEWARADPRADGPRIGLAQIALAAGRHEEAEQSFRTVVAASPRSVRAWNGLGVALDAQGRHDQAQAAYQRALAVDADNASVRNNLGLSLALSGRPKEGVTILRPLVTGPKALPRYRQNLAIALGLSGDEREAAIVAGVDLDPQSVRSNLAALKEVRSAAAQ